MTLIFVPLPQELDDNLAELTAQFETATAAKLKCQQEAESTAHTISLANRLVGGLVSEKVRWAESVEKFKKEEKTVGEWKLDSLTSLPSIQVQYGCVPTMQADYVTMTSSISLICHYDVIIK